MTGPSTIWTIGHSTHPIERFMALLQSQGIQVLIDIRRFPTSKWPQFKQENLRSALEASGIDYVHLAELGGYRGDYLAHTQTEEFLRGLERLGSFARDRRTAMMCAESMFFRCHRRFVAEALVKRGAIVFHIFPDGRTRKHELRSEPEAYNETTPAPAAPEPSTTSPRTANK